MKRCPQCNRVETDEALKFCRVDGATLVTESASLGNEAGTAPLGSGSVATEIETSILPHTTDTNIDRETAQTTVLPATQTPGTTRGLSKPNRLKIAVGLAVIAGLGIVIAGYFGEKDQAFAWLDKADEERNDYLIYLKVEPLFDSLRSDARFADLVKRVALPN